MPLHAATIIGAMTLVATATLLLLRARAKSISTLRKSLARSWTNEGDTRGTPVRRPRSPAGGGGLVGQVTSQAADRPFEANVHVGWARVTLEILELRRRSLARVGRARLRLTDDRNRLDWRLVGHGGEEVLPKRAKLWPNPHRPSRFRFKRHRLH